MCDTMHGRHLEWKTLWKGTAHSACLAWKQEDGGGAMSAKIRRQETAAETRLRRADGHAATTIRHQAETDGRET